MWGALCTQGYRVTSSQFAQPGLPALDEDCHCHRNCHCQQNSNMQLVWLHLIRMKKLTDVRDYLSYPLFIEHRWHDAAFLNCRQLQSLSDSSIAPQALGLSNVRSLEHRL